ncbi:LuxR family transcriptional regulator [Rhizobium sp. SG_E_25_P2]|uniref:helix-turn-helix transcriptional regulator n=1 Tax=Rhizobium sp. SG_E_25_P2 TaxID=2879942 RepID=UPI002476A25C|nr:LuxR family transcriptional regulator [Rhizobium sp. SG_E_25_P2]MDH6269388.1 LuxR family transcriptional regulator [Rhizobium sp. SG_E_25_P2]
MRFTEIMHFLVTISEVPSSELLSAEIERILNVYGFKYYCVFHQPKPIENAEELIVAANWPPEWVKRYVAKKYIVMDPTIRFLLRANRSFSWRQAVEAYTDNPHYRRMKAMMSDGKAHGLTSGYIFPVFSRAGLIGATTIGGPDDIELSPAEVALLETAFRNAYIRFLELIGETPTAAVQPTAEITMTHREIQALNNLAEGRTSPEIGAILNVSSNTVDWYVASLQAKLKARNRNHAVALAFRQGLIT